MAQSPLPSADMVSHDLFEMELFGDRQLTIAIPIRADQDLKRKLMGAIKSHLFAIKSVDYTINRYGNHWSFEAPSEDQLSVASTLRRLNQRAAQLLDDLTQGSTRPNRMGLFAAETALIRLKPTFRSALMLIAQGYAFEAGALVRLILEQIAWAHAVYMHDDREDILKQSATGAISGLKAVEPSVGRIYGALSKLTHLDGEASNCYITDADNELVEIRFQLTKEANVTLGFLIAVLGLLRSTAIKISGEYFVERPEIRLGDDWLTNAEQLEIAFQQLQSTHPEISWLPPVRLHNTMHSRTGE